VIEVDDLDQGVEFWLAALDATAEPVSEQSRGIYRRLRLPDSEIRILRQRLAAQTDFPCDRLGRSKPTSPIRPTHHRTVDAGMKQAPARSTKPTDNRSGPGSADTAWGLAGNHQGPDVSESTRPPGEAQRTPTAARTSSSWAMAQTCSGGSLGTTDTPAGNLLGFQGLPTDSIVTNVGSVPTLRQPLLLTPGVVESVSAVTDGVILWLVTWVPLDIGASLVAA
jgi:hypothetical protein